MKSLSKVDRTVRSTRSVNTGVKNKRKLQRFRDNFELLILTLPVIISLFIFHYLPIVGIILAFKKYTYAGGIFGSKWVGLSNFTFFFNSQDAWRITRNTVSYSIVFLIIGTVSAVTVALLLNELRSRIAIKIYQTVMILPNFLSWVVIGFIAYAILNPVSGVLNQIIEAMGGEAVNWYGELKAWPIILVVVNTWNSVGMASIMYFAALTGIDPNLYEAAEIDGANRWQQVKHISIPSLVPLIVILNILAIGGLFRGDFGLFYQVTMDVGVLYPVTDIIDTYVFRGLAESADIGRTTAIGLFQSVVGLILILSTNAAVKKIDPEKALY